MKLAFFQVLEARVEDFLHAVQLRTPEILHLLETDVDCVESRVQMATKVSQTRVVHQDSDQNRNRCWNRSQGDCQNLRVVQHCLNSTKCSGEFSIHYRSANVYSALPA